ncbi:MAG: ribokinase [Firmicutes bacterium]|nr:ribokinase [Bacillota bacterium]
MKSICVVGSLNMDLVATVERFPRPGETVTGKEFGTYTGGKGANQAVASGRLGANVRMVGKVGDDFYGKKYLEVLKNNGVKIDGIDIEPGTSTGVAVIEVDSSGANHIVVIPGANGKVDTEFINRKLNYILESDIFLFQLEIPLETVVFCMKKVQETQKTLRQNKKIIILDPAPAVPLEDEVLEYVDYITPNETEIEVLTGGKIDTEEDIKKASFKLLDRGVKTVIAKAGEKGAFIVERERFVHVPAPKVNVVDTTAAGDSFNAGLAFALSQNRELVDCVKFANIVASLAVTAKGAQEAMPNMEQVEAFMDRI